MIAQFKNARAYRGQRSVVTWSFALLQLPQLKSQVLPNVLRESLENLSGVTLPNDGRVSAWLLTIATISVKPPANIQLNVYRCPARKSAGLRRPLFLGPCDFPKGLAEELDRQQKSRGLAQTPNGAVCASPARNQHTFRTLPGHCVS